MHRLIRDSARLVLSLVCLSVSAQDGLPKNVEGSQFILPVMKDGEKDMLIQGKTVKTFGSYVNLSGIRIRLFPTKKRDADIQIFSPKASYDNTKELASSGKRVNVRALHPAKQLKKGQVRHQTIIDGTGFDFSNKNRTIGIRSRVVVRMHSIGVEGKKVVGEHSEISAKRLDYKFAKLPSTIIFHETVMGTFSSPRKEKKTGKVVVEQFKVEADKLIIHQGANRTIESFQATGNVTITQLTGTQVVATGDRAIYVLEKVDKPLSKVSPTVKVQGVQTIRLTGNPAMSTPTGKLIGAKMIIMKMIKGVMKVSTNGRSKMSLMTDSSTTSLLPELGPKKAKLPNNALKPPKETTETVPEKMP